MMRDPVLVHAAVANGQDARAGTTAWNSLYRVGAAAAVGVLLLLPIQMIVFVVAPPPTTVGDWFALYQRNPPLGLLAMDLLLIVDYVLAGLVILALGVALWRVSPALTLIAGALEFVALPTYLASTGAFEMLALSNAHAMAGTESERALLLAAGQALLVTWQGTAFAVSYTLSGVALLMISTVMWRSARFGRFTAATGMVAGAAGIVPASAGTVGLVLSLISLVPLVIWIVRVAHTLIHLAASSPAVARIAGEA
jgi:hypothetical protein